MFLKSLGLKLKTKFSNNIRNNFGFLNRTHPETIGNPDKLFIQQGRKVFKEVIPIAADLIQKHLEQNGIKSSDLKRVWLHQANINMNHLICKKVLGAEITHDFAPTILDRYANTASAGFYYCFPSV